MYKLQNQSIKRLSDGASIPICIGNKDYDEYLVWISEGNTPEPEFTEAELAQQLEDAKPKVITPLQARLALNEIGLRQVVETAILTATQDVKDFYEFALEWKRDNAQLLAMATSLSMDSVAIDNFFLLASSK